MTEMSKGRYQRRIRNNIAESTVQIDPTGISHTVGKSLDLSLCSENIGTGDVVYYVGAEEGEMPALCQMWGAEVVLFEPNPKVWSHFPLLWTAIT
jgi:hypothetical protein